MNLSTIITSIRSEFSATIPNIPIYLQLAPGDVQPPYAVMRLSSIEPGEGDLAEKDYSANVAFAVITTSDTECLAALDSIGTAFDRGSINDLYSTTLSTMSFDIQYTEQAALWVAEASFSIRWTTGA